MTAEFLNLRLSEVPIRSLGIIAGRYVRPMPRMALRDRPAGDKDSSDKRAIGRNGFGQVHVRSKAFKPAGGPASRLSLLAFRLHTEQERNVLDDVRGMRWGGCHRRS